MFKFITACFFLFPFFSKCQLSESNKNLLRQELSKQINELRKEQGLPALIFDDILKKAAEFHSSYQAKEDELTHDENKSKYATPEKRVKAFKGKDFEIVGENCLFVIRKETPLHKKEIPEIASEMFSAWKNSPSHYANMTEPEYVFGDLGFDYNPKSSRIYATQVFGKLGFKVPNQLSKNAFGVMKETKECDELYAQYENYLLNMGNGITIEGDEVVLYYHNIEHFKLLLNGPNDGLAIDIIQKNQLICGQPNQLDFSPIYDGILLKPAMASDILANNEAKSEYRLISKIAKIPTDLIDKEISPSLIFIKNGKRCKYVFPCEIQLKDFALIPFEPIVKDESTVELKLDGITHSDIIYYSFNTSKISDTQLPFVPKSKQIVYSAQIQSYSSVDGDLSHNNYLHTARAEFIQSHLLSTIKIDANKIDTEMHENWKLMNFQLHYFNREDLLDLSHDSIKAIIAEKDSTLDWQSLLFEQRTASAIIHYSGNYSQVAKEQSLEEFNLRTAVVMNDPLLVNKALYQMYQTKKYHPSILFEPQITVYFENHQEVIANYAALLSVNFQENILSTTKFIHRWLQSPGELKDDQRINLLHLYSLLGKFLIDDWDLASQRLANVIHPNKIGVIFQDSYPEKLILNLNITYLDYFGQINDSENISKTFYSIKEYVAPKTLSEEETIQLALFYNYWSVFKTAVDFLLPKANIKELNENALFILLETMTVVQYHYSEQEYYEINEIAKNKNRARWCNWVNNNFQVLRDYHLKRMYCESCD